MHILAIIGQKGGTGKTTTALGVAVAACRAGRRTLLIDLDPQVTAAKWGDRRAEKTAPAVVTQQASRLPQAIEAAKAEGYDLVVIDTAGKSDAAATAAARAANFVLMPIQPQLYDIETLPNLADVLTLAGNPPSAVLVNRAPFQGRRHEETKAEAAAQGFQVCPVVVYARAAHGDAGNAGQVAAESEPDSKAGREMTAVYDYCAAALKAATAAPRRKSA